MDPGSGPRPPPPRPQPRARSRAGATPSPRPSIDGTTTLTTTGVRRLPRAPSNPSGSLALAVAQSVFPLLAGARRVGHIFETSYASVDRELPQLMTRHRPDVVLMFGLAA